MLRTLDHCESSGLGQRGRQRTGVVTHKIAHYLTGHITPTNEDAAGAEVALVLVAAHGRTALDELVAHLVCPRHHIPNRLCTGADAVEHGQEVAFEKLGKIFLAAVADERRLVSNRVKVDRLPRATHLLHLLLIGEDRMKRLRDLENVQEAHCNMAGSADEVER